MDPIEKRELKRKAWMRLAAQRRRAGLLRGRVVVLSLLCFAVLWGAVFAQMITGNDPVLGGKEAAAATRTVANAKKAVETTELEPHRKRHQERAGGDGTEIEAEPETERSVTAELEEAEALEIEAIQAAEAEEAAAAEFEEPLVTSQS
jgi:non-ribosomal peptide synthetase component E (peptide arylation enzyme)